MNISHSRVIAALLALMLTATVFASCSDAKDPSVQTKAGTGSVTQTDTTEEMSRENTPDKLPDDIDFGGETVVIYTRDTFSKYFTAEDITEEIMNDAVYNRQLKVEERLKVKINAVECGGAADVASKVKTIAQSNSDECDIAALRNYESYGLITDKVFYNYYENEYIDFSAPWWSQALINASTIGKDRVYVLMGDIDASFIAAMQSVFFNKGIYEKYIGNPNELYQTVIDRKWTVDKLIELSKRVHDDVNGNGIQDKDDIYGYGASPCANQAASVSGVKIIFSSFNADGYPEMVFNNSHTVDAIAKLYSAMWNNEGAYITAGSQDGLNELTDKFKNETLMFYNLSVGSLGAYREMNTDYTVLPMPMLDEDQGEYCTEVSTGADGISVLISCPDYDRACITLEALAAEGYRSITYKYYETALKKTYARDDMVAHMLDILSGTVYFDFMFLHGMQFSNIGNFIPTLLLKKDAAGFASEYDKIKDVYQKTLDNLLKFYQTGEE